MLVLALPVPLEPGDKISSQRTRLARRGFGSDVSYVSAELGVAGQGKIGREERGSRASDLGEIEDAMNALLYSSEKRRLPVLACE